MTRGALLAVLGACVCACAHAPARAPAAEEPGVAVVEAEGWAALADDGRPDAGARGRALAEAQRAAVETAVGVRLTARTRVEAAIATQATIETRVRGTLLGWTVLSERESAGLLRTRIRARVRVGPAPGAPGLPPLVAVRLTGPSAESAASAVRRALRAGGLRVTDDPDADLVVAGTVTGDGFEAVPQFSSWRARVRLTAVRTSTGEFLAEESREASAADPAARVAEERAAALAGELAANALKGQAFTYLTYPVSNR